MKNSATVLMLLFLIVFAACKKETQKETGTPCSKFSLDGTWTRTATGPNGNAFCLGEIIEYKNNQGIVKYEPGNCPFRVGDVKWQNFLVQNCTIENSYTADPTLTTFAFRPGSISFINANKVLIHGETYTK
jgi:hypothetical protein